MPVAVNRSYVDAAPRDVFAALSDARSYPYWAIGARGIRGVEGDWPSEGARLHHSLGAFGVTVVRDSTVVLEHEPDALLVLEARLRPIGVALVRLHLTPVEEGTLVTMEERMLQRPAGGERSGALGVLLRLRDRVVVVLLHLRNRWALHRLGRLARGQRVQRRSGRGAPRP